MGWWDDFTGQTAADAAQQNIASLGALKEEGMGFLGKGLKNSTGAINNSLSDFSGLASKYGAGTDLYLDALGVNGAGGTGRAQSAFTTSPGYQFAVDEALNAINRTADARGMLRGGNTTQANLDRASGLAAQEYGGWLNNLSGLISPEMAATSGKAGLNTSLAGLHERDANNRVNLSSNVTGGIANQNSAAASALGAGAGNVAGLGLNLLSLGTGMAGYGGFGSGTPPFAPGNHQMGMGLY